MISTQNFRVEHGLQVGDVVIDAASGIVSATSFFGDGSGLTGVGGGSGAITACCTSNFISCNTSLPSITSAENNFFVGFNAGNGITSGSCNNFFGFNAGRGRKGITFIGITSSTALAGESNNSYPDVSGTGGDGSGATFYVERDGNGDVTIVDIVIGGRDYNVGNTLTIDGADVGGSSGTDDITFTIDTVEGSTGSDNNFFGRCAGLNNITGCYNNFFGSCAGKYNTTGYGNNYIGVGAGLSNTTGCLNTYIGLAAGFANTTGSYNNFFGFGAGSAASGSNNNFFGIFAGSSLLSVFGDGEYNSGCANNFFGSQSGILNTTGCNNNFFGNLSGAANTTGSNNNFFGFGAGSNNTTGSYNIAIGDNVQLPNVSGNNQLAIGVSNTSWINGDENFNVGIGTTNPQTRLQINGVLGFETFTGNYAIRTNIRIGDNTTGASITDGYDNIFMGIGAGNSTTTGTNNNFLGNCAGRHNTTGYGNNFMGSSAGCCNTTGCNNNFFGSQVGYFNTTGSYNNFFGDSAGLCNTTGCFNNFLGASAGFDNTSGSYNNFFGAYVGCSNTIGGGNNFFGQEAGSNNTTGCFNNFLGVYAGQGRKGRITSIGITSSTALAGEANNTYSDVSGTGGNGSNATFYVERDGNGDVIIVNITIEGYDYYVGNILTIDGAAVGGSSGTDDVTITVDTVEGSTGSDNNFFGRCAGRYNTTGENNNFFGGQTGQSNTSGTHNNFLGRQVGYSNTTGSYNNFLGNCAGFCNTTGCYNNFLGASAGFLNTIGCYNNFFGAYAGCSNTTGCFNNFLGVYAGACNTTGSCNNFFGSSAGQFNITGNFNNFFGKYSGISTSASRKVIIGSGFNYSNLFDSPDTTKDTQFAVGIRTDANPAQYWLVGDENFNVGIGTTSPTSKLTVTGDVLVSGVVTATSFVGDGSGLTNLPTPSRITVTGITEIISSSGIGNTDIFGFKTYSILKVGISTAAWIRIYTDSDSRSNDASRPINIDPTSGSGIVAEFVSAGATTIKTGPVPIGYNDDDPEENIIYMSVNNLSGISTSIEVNLTILKMEE